MNNSVSYRILADFVLLMHLSIVVFVVSGLVLIVVGGMRGWRWVRNPWFRIAHLGAISIVVIQSWIGVICPLTTLEMALRTRAGEAVYSGGFIAHWFEAILYYQAPRWVFMIIYTVFGLVVVVSWIVIRPRSFSGSK